MTKKIYFEDCYVKEFDAVAEKVNNEQINLDQTAFYPEGGGQPSDTGTIGDARVKKVEKKGNEIIHIISEGDTPEVGNKVHCSIDWEKRYSHMKYHSAQHILSAIILNQYAGRTKGNQIYSDRARIDFDVNVSEKINEIEKEVNSIINEGREINIYSMSREKALEKLDPERTRINLLPDSIKKLRIVEIENLDKTACAGTHVKNTKELGKFEITNTESKGKNKKRIEFILH